MSAGVIAAHYVADVPVIGSDLWANATPVTLSGAASPRPTYVGSVASNALYTYPEAGEVQPAGFTVGKTAWWKWVATFTGYLSIDTAGSSIDTEIAAYTGAALATLTKVASDSDSLDGARSYIPALAVTTGVTYYFQVGAYLGNTGSYQLNLRPLDRGCPHDLWANARTITISAAVPTYTDGWWSTQDCGTEAGEPLNVIGNALMNTIWWKYTPLANGTAVFDSSPSRRGPSNITDNGMAVYTGSAVNALTKRTEDDSSGGNATAKCTLAVVAGTTYYVQLGGYAFRGVSPQEAINVTGPVTV